MTDFKVGDKVTMPHKRHDIGTILVIYTNRFNEFVALIGHNKGGDRYYADTFPVNSLNHYKEPLKYSTGEELRVGDLVYHSSLCEVGEVSEIFDKSIRIHNLNNNELWVWTEFDKMKLRKRRGC